MVDSEEEEEEDEEVSVCSFLFSLVMCFISRAAMLPPLPPCDKEFLSRTDWASLRLTQKQKYFHHKQEGVYFKIQLKKCNYYQNVPYFTSL